jgi:hypothetical protein
MRPEYLPVLLYHLPRAYPPVVCSRQYNEIAHKRLAPSLETARLLWRKPSPAPEPHVSVDPFCGDTPQRPKSERAAAFRACDTELQRLTEIQTSLICGERAERLTSASPDEVQAREQSPMQQGILGRTQPPPP